VWATTAHLRPALHDLPGGGHPARAGHAAVHQHHVGDELLDQVEGGLAGVGLAHHLPAADLLQQGAQHPPDRRMVVDQQDPSRAAGPRDRRLHGLYRLRGIADELRSDRLFSMKDVGIVGLPQSGKTTLFNALTRAGVPAGGAAGKASVAAVPVPDPRVDVLSELERSRKRVFVQARFVDVAGLSAGASSSGGLSAQGLGALREADALAMVLAAWDGGGPDPVEAAAELTLELTVADLESVAGGAEKAAKKARAGVKDAALEADVLARARDLLDRGTPLRAAGWEPEEARVLRNFAPLTLKPALAVLNLAEADAAAAEERAAEAEAKLGMPTVAVAAALEAEAAELAPEDAADLLAGYGVGRGGLDQVVGAAWRLLDLIVFLTTGEDETRAWEVRRGATAPEAAGRIHSDLQRGFIRAEVIGYDDVVAAGGWDLARSKGLLRTESKSYVVQEGDVVHIRFSV
jgi:ribosome-binding ATPase